MKGYAIAIPSSTISVFWSMHSLSGVGKLQREQQLKVGPDVNLPCPQAKQKYTQIKTSPFRRKLLLTVLPYPYKLEKEGQLKVSPDVKLCPPAEQNYTQTTTSPFQRK